MGLSHFRCIYKQNTVRKEAIGIPLQEIITLLQQKDQTGMQLFLQHYTPFMRYIIRPILPNEADIEDCLSEISLKVWEKIDGFDPDRGSFTAWLTALTRNTAINRARQLARRPHEPLTEDTVSNTPSPEELLLQRERQEMLKSALLSLNTKEQILCYRKYYYLQSTAQIAAELGSTERAVEGKLYRLRKKLQKLLGGELFE